MSTANKKNVVNLTCTAMLAAMVIILSLTPLGYIPIGPLKLTLLALPVAIGGAVLGPWAGTVLGAVFGLTSFCTCCFGMDAFGEILFGIHPLFTFLMCVVPRVLCGLLPALLCKALPPRRNTLWKQILCCGLTAATNTILFLGALWLFFGQALAENEALINLLGGAVTTFTAVLIGFAGVNALVEIALNLTVGAAVSRAVTAALSRLH